MRHLLIVGARGWGREVYATFKDTDPYLDGEIDVRGFLDSKADAFEGLKGDYPPIICSPEDYQIQEDDVFFIAMGEPKWRKYYADIIEKKGGTFITIICKNSYVNPTATIGVGSFISSWTCVSDNATIGNHVMVHGFCTVGHDVKIGNYSSIETYCFFGGYSSMGDESFMHVRSQIIPHKSIGNNVQVASCSVVMKNFKDNLNLFGYPAIEYEL